LIIEVPRILVKKLFFHFRVTQALIFCQSFIKSPTPSENVGPGKTEFTVTPVFLVSSAKPRATGNLSGFGHAIVDHFFGICICGFAGNKNDTAPVFADHLVKVSPRQSHTA
jgi:hypothetical protein